MKGLLFISLEDGSTEVVDVEFTERELEVLALFCEDAWRLRTAEIFGSKAANSFTFSFTSGEGVSLVGDLIDEEAWDACMLRLRPLVLEEEPASFLRVASLIGKRVKSSTIRSQLKGLRKMFRGERLPVCFEVKLDGQSRSMEEVFHLWMNAFEHHRDREKREFFLSLEKLGFDRNKIRYYVHLQTVEKLRAVMMLFKIIIDIVGEPVKPNGFVMLEQASLAAQGSE